MPAAVIAATAALPYGACSGLAIATVRAAGSSSAARPAVGSTGESFGAPFDLFLSADLSYPRELVAAGLAREEDLFAYAVGRLVVWAPNDSPVDPTAGLAALLDPAARTVAIANPEHAPYGKAAVAAMTAAGIYDQVSPRLVLGEDVAQAAALDRGPRGDRGASARAPAHGPRVLRAGGAGDALPGGQVVVGADRVHAAVLVHRAAGGVRAVQPAVRRAAPAGGVRGGGPPAARGVHH